jgi:phosphatidylglycerophosphate synthase
MKRVGQTMGASGGFALAFGVVSVADCLSLARIPLGLVFLLVAGQRSYALAVLFVAAVTDVLDGWVARRCGPRRPGEAHRGDWLDPLCDKLFAAAVVTGLLLTRSPPLALVGLFLARELLQLVSVMVMRMVPVLHRASRDYDFRAHPVGKAATVAQFATAAALVLGHPAAWPLAVLCAALGVVSVGIYVYRIRRLLARPSAPVQRRA